MDKNHFLNVEFDYKIQWVTGKQMMYTNFVW